MQAEGQRTPESTFTEARPAFVLPMAALFSLICFVHSLLRNMRDSLVVTAEGSGAEVIPFIQVWFLLPATLGVTWMFTRLLRKYSQRQVFLFVLSSFIAFFAVFGSVLYPLRETLSLPVGKGVSLAYFGGMLAMLRHWVLSSFYVVAELWGCMVTSVLFWGLANEVSRLQEAKKWYGVFAIGGNIGAVLSGLVPTMTQRLVSTYSVYAQLTVVIAVSIGIIVLYQRMCRRLFPIERYAGLHNVRQVESKAKAEVNGFRKVLANRYLLCMGVMVCGYGIVLNFAELMWRGQLQQVFTDYNDYGRVLGYATTVEGLLSLVLSVSIPFLFARLGWTWTALVCPVVMLLCAGLFFFFQLLPIQAAWLPGAVLIAGGALTVCGRATKHSLFDAAKDMAYIPLASEVKLESKALIDGAGFRLSRTGSSCVYQGFLLTFGTIAATTPFVGVVVIGVLGVWVGSTVSLGKQFTEQEIPVSIEDEAELIAVVV